jgi:tRNA (guanine10-N2)-dimethyltransferase
VHPCFAVQQRAVRLSGEHPTLPAAELQALLAIHDPAATAQRRGLVAFVQPRESGGCDRALASMALAHEWGVYWGQAPDTAEGLGALAQVIAEKARGLGSAAIAAERQGPPGRSTRDQLERRLGMGLKAAGRRVDLVSPELTVFAWLENGVVVVGERRGELDRGRHEARIADERAHFSPVSLHPRRAACLLHLARAKPGARVYDPFCGTGTFVLEAAIEGYEAWGSDLDAFMVQGTLQTLADTMDEPLPATVFQADVGAAPDLVDQVDAIVTDLPYGRASSSGAEGLQALYDRALDAFRRLLRPGSRAVVGCAVPGLLRPEVHGFRVAETHEERVHRSLTRHYLVLSRD